MRRREFLKLSAAGGAALVVGFRIDAEPSSFQPNGWVRIEPGGKIVLTVGKQEMGQGVRTSLPMILADELDADWQSIELLQAEPSPQFQRLGTGGSGSVYGSWKPLRTAGAAARTMLIGAAAAKWNVDAASLRTEKGFVINTKTNERLSYGALASDAAKQPVPAEPKLKAMSELRIVGQRVKKVDAPDVVSGKAIYGIDARMPGMLYASIERPPTVGGTLVKFDATKAMKVRGVRSVVAIKAGVAVVAENSWAAMKGREALAITWEPGPNRAFNSDAHIKALEAAASEPGVTIRKEGEGAAALARAAKTIEARYHYPCYAHAPVEPMNCVASFRDGTCELRVPTQAPNRAQQLVAEFLGIKPENVIVHPTLIGGGFGRRLWIDYAIEAAELSRAIANPVQVLWTRQDDMRHGHFQAASVHQLRAAFDENNAPLFWGHKKVSSYHNLRGAPTAQERADVEYNQDSAWGVYDVPYAFPSIEATYLSIDVPVPIGPWRAVFSPSSTFARECFVDEVAQHLGKDPLQSRLDMLGEPYDITAGSLKIDRTRLRRVLEVVREKSKWGSPLAQGRGRGVACNVYDGDTHIAYVVEVTAHENSVRVDRVVAAVDCGVVINPTGIEQQIEGGIIWGLSSALKGHITFRDGHAEQSTYRDFEVLRMNETPAIEIHIVPSHGEQPFGMGEPPVPPIVPAVVNAIFAATGKRIRALPIRL